jgi:hypothetical protein
MSKLDVEKRNANRSWNNHTVPISAQPTPLKADIIQSKPKKRPYQNMVKQQITPIRRSDGRKELNCTFDVDELKRLSVDGKIKVIIYQDDDSGKMCMSINPYRSGAL